MPIRPKAIKESDFTFPGQIGKYKGKVRDVYYLENELMVMVVSDRISAFDHVLPKAIPYKGQILNNIAAFNLQATEDICPNWMLSIPDPNVMIGKKCEPFKVEMVIRGFLTGHAWRTYKSGKRTLCGVDLPEGMKEHDHFDEPIITPATKAEEGHDEDISREDIIARGIVSEEDYLVLEKYTRALFERGSNLANERGLILVDTKYEFGKVGDTIFLIDEIHTPDSSRYFIKEGYVERQEKGEKQKQLSKEFVREWLMENDFQGLDGQKMPDMPDDFVDSITERYGELYYFVMGREFEKHSGSKPIEDRIRENTVKALNELGLK